MYTKLDLELEDKDSIVLELKLKALIFDTIYHIRILRDLIENSVTSAQHWHWQKQLRSDEVMIIFALILDTKNQTNKFFSVGFIYTIILK